MSYLRSASFVAVALLPACGQLPEATAPQSQQSHAALGVALGDLASGPTVQLSFCEADGATSDAACAPDSTGLKAAGLGGVFIPLNTTVPTATIGGGQVDFDIAINGLAARCAKSPVTVDAATRTIEAAGFYCNWAGIGNVLSTVQLTADWQSQDGTTFGGRYLIRFNGTGNGAGSGTFRARRG